MMLITLDSFLTCTSTVNQPTHQSAPISKHLQNPPPWPLLGAKHWYLLSLHQSPCFCPHSETKQDPYNCPTFQGSSSDSPKMYISAQAHHSKTFRCTHSQSQGPVHSTCLGTLPSLSLGHILLIVPIFFAGRLPLPPAQVKPLCSMLLHWTLSSFSPHLNYLLPAPWHLVMDIPHSGHGASGDPGEELEAGQPACKKGGCEGRPAMRADKVNTNSD